MFYYSLDITYIYNLMYLNFYVYSQYEQWQNEYSFVALSSLLPLGNVILILYFCHCLGNYVFTFMYTHVPIHY